MTHAGGPHRAVGRGSRFGSEIDQVRAAAVARWALCGEALISGLIYTFASHTVISGNVAFARQLFPLPLWGVVWVLAAVATMTPRTRAVGHAVLALTYVLFALTTAATYFTGDISAPAGPVRVLALGLAHWWLRARSLAQAEQAEQAQQARPSPWPRYRGTES